MEGSLQQTLQKKKKTQEMNPFGKDMDTSDDSDSNSSTHSEKEEDDISSTSSLSSSSSSSSSSSCSSDDDDDNELRLIQVEKEIEASTEKQQKLDQMCAVLRSKIAELDRETIEKKRRIQEIRQLLAELNS
jgi:septal ring factor EnvC (AmiA/AmiB activator)